MACIYNLEACRYLLVHGLNAASVESVLDEAAELLLVSLFVLLKKVAHVVGHMDTHDVLPITNEQKG